MNIYLLAYPVYSRDGQLFCYCIFVIRFITHFICPPDRSGTLPPLPFHAEGTRFYSGFVGLIKPPDYSGRNNLLINAQLSPRGRFNDKKHGGWLMINILIINIRRYP